MADGRRVVTLARSPPARSGRGTPGCGLRGTTNTSSLVGIVVAGPSTGSGLAGFSGVCCGAPALLGGGYCSLLIPQRLIPAGLSLRVEHEQYGFYTQRVSLYAIVLPWQAVSSLTWCPTLTAGISRKNGYPTGRRSVVLIIACKCHNLLDDFSSTHRVTKFCLPIYHCLIANFGIFINHPSSVPVILW